mmetsp:Transcript_31438/g.56959  ORF Transcript_31438/g.56959 Transcript_31438/m.56959 type:complete len:99 (+) Transcript_31438:88-384(+)
MLMCTSCITYYFPSMLLADTLYLSTHATHTLHLLMMKKILEGGYYIFPGSITGAYSACTPNVNPSFILLAVQGTKVVCYVYELKDGEVDVSKTEFSKQ